MASKQEGKILVQAYFDPKDIETLDALAEKFSCPRSSVLKMIVKNITIDFNINLTLNKTDK